MDESMSKKENLMKKSTIITAVSVVAIVVMLMLLFLLALWISIRRSAVSDQARRAAPMQLVAVP